MSFSFFVPIANILYFGIDRAIIFMALPGYFSVFYRLDDSASFFAGVRAGGKATASEMISEFTEGIGKLVLHHGFTSQKIKGRKAGRINDIAAEELKKLRKARKLY